AGGEDRRRVKLCRGKGETLAPETKTLRGPEYIFDRAEARRAVKNLEKQFLAGLDAVDLDGSGMPRPRLRRGEGKDALLQILAPARGQKPQAPCAGAPGAIIIRSRRGGLPRSPGGKAGRRARGAGEAWSTGCKCGGCGGAA